MITISEKSAQALQILELMFTRKDSVWSGSFISRELGIGVDLVFDRNRAMSRAGILRSFRGHSGGFRIEKDDVNLWEVACAVENQIPPETQSEPWQHLSSYFERTLKRTRIIDLLGETK